MVSKDLKVVKHVYKGSDFEFTVERPESWLSVSSEDLKLILETSLLLSQASMNISSDTEDMSQMNLTALFSFMKYSPNVQQYGFKPNINAISFHKKQEIKNICAYFRKTDKQTHPLFSSRKTKSCRRVTINGQKFWHRQQTIKMFDLLTINTN